MTSGHLSPLAEPGKTEPRLVVIAEPVASRSYSIKLIAMERFISEDGLISRENVWVDFAAIAKQPGSRRR